MCWYDKKSEPAYSVIVIDEGTDVKHRELLRHDNIVRVIELKDNPTCLVEYNNGARLLTLQVGSTYGEFVGVMYPQMYPQQK